MPSLRSKTKPRPNIHLQFEAIGTQWVIDAEASAEHAQPLVERITACITAFDKTYSRFRADSLVTTMSKYAGAYVLPADGEALLGFYRQMYDVTRGAVTPLVGQLLADAGYDAMYSLQPKPTHRPPAWDDVLVYQYPTLRLAKPALLDFGAAGKGYLVDNIAALLDEQGVVQYCVDAGGDMRCRGLRPQQVGLEDPEDAGKAIGVVRLQNRSMCGSAGNRRQWADYHHIIDPYTMQSPQHIAAVWAVADTTLLADGMTTCLFFTEPDILQQHFSFEYVIMYTDRTVHLSAGFPGELFTVRKD
jgi:thiamine biosynthesis lipoprotein